MKTKREAHDDDGDASSSDQASRSTIESAWLTMLSTSALESGHGFSISVSGGWSSFSLRSGSVLVDKVPKDSFSLCLFFFFSTSFTVPEDDEAADGEKETEGEWCTRDLEPLRARDALVLETPAENKKLMLEIRG